MTAAGAFGAESHAARIAYTVRTSAAAVAIGLVPTAIPFPEEAA